METHCGKTLYVALNLQRFGIQRQEFLVSFQTFHMAGFPTPKMVLYSVEMDLTKEVEMEWITEMMNA